MLRPLACDAHTPPWPCREQCRLTLSALQAQQAPQVAQAQGLTPAALAAALAGAGQQGQAQAAAQGSPAAVHALPGALPWSGAPRSAAHPRGRQPMGIDPGAGAGRLRSLGCAHRVQSKHTRTAVEVLPEQLLAGVPCSAVFSFGELGKSNTLPQALSCHVHE